MFSTAALTLLLLSIMNRLISNTLSYDPLNHLSSPRPVRNQAPFTLNPDEMERSRFWGHCPFTHAKMDVLRGLLVNETSCVMATIENCDSKCPFSGKCFKDDPGMPEKIMAARKDIFELKVPERVPYITGLLDADNNLTECNDAYQARLTNDAGKSDKRFGRYSWKYFVKDGKGQKIQVCAEKFCSYYGISMTALLKAQKQLRENTKGPPLLTAGSKDRKKECKEIMKVGKGDSDAVMFMVTWMKDYAAAGFGEIQPHGDQSLEDNRSAQGSEIVYRLHLRHWDPIHHAYTSECGITVDSLNIKQFKIVFNTHPELKNIHRARQKANFGECTICLNFISKFLNTSRHDTDTRLLLQDEWLNGHMAKVVSLRGVYNDNVFDTTSSDSDSLMLEVDAWTKKSSQVFRWYMYVYNNSSTLNLCFSFFVLIVSCLMKGTKNQKGFHQSRGERQIIYVCSF